MRYTIHDLAEWLRSHGTIRGGSANQTDLRGMHLTLAAPLAANSGVGPNSGDPMVLGRGTSPSFGMCGVCETSYTPPTGTPTGNVTVNFEGVFNLTVVGKSSIGGGSVAMDIGDLVYADGGTYDPVTGWLYGFTLDANSTSGVKFGNLLDAVASGVTQVSRVRLKVGG
jgi:hypothetical protein